MVIHVAARVAQIATRNVLSSKAWQVWVRNAVGLWEEKTTAMAVII